MQENGWMTPVTVSEVMYARHFPVSPTGPRWAVRGGVFPYFFKSDILLNFAVSLKLL